MKAVFLDRGSFSNTICIELPEPITQLIEYQNTCPEQVAERIKDADLVLTNKVKLDEEAINNASSLQLVQVMATGINNVDIKSCQARNIPVQNVTDYSIISVPEHTFSMLLMLRRHLMSYISDVKSGKWQEAEHFCFLDYPIKDLSGTTMAIIGRGALGKSVAKIAEAFGITVIFAEHKGANTIRSGYVEFEEALKVADVVSLHCPLTEETTNLINTAEFNLMKSSALLLNISRGGLVNEQALLEALEKQIIAGAAFDVATEEPMPIDHPLQALTQRPNFLLTPHIAWASNEAMQKLVDIAVQKITLFLDTKKCH